MFGRIGIPLVALMLFSIVPISEAQEGKVLILSLANPEYGTVDEDFSYMYSVIGAMGYKVEIVKQLPEEKEKLLEYDVVIVPSYADLSAGDKLHLSYYVDNGGGLLVLGEGADPVNYNQYLVKNNWYFWNEFGVLFLPNVLTAKEYTNTYQGEEGINHYAVIAEVVGDPSYWFWVPVEDMRVGKVWGGGVRHYVDPEERWIYYFEQPYPKIGTKGGRGKNDEVWAPRSLYKIYYNLRTNRKKSIKGEEYSMLTMNLSFSKTRFNDYADKIHVERACTLLVYGDKLHRPVMPKPAAIENGVELKLYTIARGPFRAYDLTAEGRMMKLSKANLLGADVYTPIYVMKDSSWGDLLFRREKGEWVTSFDTGSLKYERGEHTFLPEIAVAVERNSGRAVFIGDTSLFNDYHMLRLKTQNEGFLRGVIDWLANGGQVETGEEKFLIIIDRFDYSWIDAPVLLPPELVNPSEEDETGDKIRQRTRRGL